MDLNWRRQLWRSLLTSIMAIVLIFGTFGCGSGSSVPKPPGAGKYLAGKVQPNISEASPPAVIQKLRQELDSYQPQVTIVSPKPDEVLQDNTISIQFQVQDLPIFKNADLGLGPHLQVFLDNQPYQAVYDVTQPLLLEDLPPGTHTLRAIASSPWNESFKNEAAYAQTTFHIFTKTDQNNPNPTLPLLTYNQPQGSYGAEPILLDFYLTNTTPENTDTAQVRIRCTINGESFTLEPTPLIYLQGFKSGKNWVQLELIDAQDNPIKNAFNNTIRVINYNKEGQDTLSHLVRGELSVDDARGIVDPNYVAKQPTPTPTPEVTPAPTPEEVSTPEATPTPIPTPAATETPEPPIPVTVPSPAPVVEETPPAATSTPTPVAIPSPVPTVEKTPVVEAPQKAPTPVEVTTPSETQPTAAKPIEPPKPGGFFNRFQSSGTGETTVAPEPLATETKQAEQPKFGGFFNRFRLPAAPSPSLSPTLSKPVEVKPSISPQPSSEPTTSVEEKSASENTSQTKQTESSKDATTESDLKSSSGQELSAPATPAKEAPKASEPSEIPASKKTTGVLTES